MRKYLILFICCVFALCSYSQNIAGIFYNDALIPHSRVTGQRIGNLAGAYFSMGLSGAKRNIQIEGETSDLVITEKQPTFKVAFNQEFTKYGAIFSDIENMDYLVLVSVKKGKNKRQLQTGSYGLTGIESNLSDKKIIPLNIDENEDGTFSITPKKELKPGEYVFWFTKKLLDGDQIEGQEPKTKPYNYVFDFTVKK